MMTTPDRNQILTDLAQAMPELSAEAAAIVAAVPDPQILAIKESLGRAPTRDDAIRNLGELTAGPAALGGDALQAGRQLYARQKFRLSAALCGNLVIRTYCTRRSVIDATTLATLIAGVLLQQQTAGWNVTAMACLVARAGLSEFCNDEWSKPKAL